MIQKFFGLLLGGLGLLVFGVLLHQGEIPEIEEEIPWAKDLGVAFAIIGGVFLLIYVCDLFAPKSRLTHLLKGVVGGGAFCAFGLACLVAAGIPSYEAWQLSDHGEVASAEVLRVDWVPKVGKYGSAHSTAEVRIGGEVHRIDPWKGGGGNTAVRVIYLPEDPRVLRLADDDASIADFLEQDPGWWLLGLGGFGGLCLTLYGLFAIWSGLTGKNREEFLEPG